MRRKIKCTILYFLFFLILATCHMAMATDVYIGTYTNPPGYGSAQGIYHFALGNGALISSPILAAQTTAPLINPSYLLVMQNKNSLYAVDEFFQVNGPIASSGVTAYGINSNHRLTALNTQLTGLAAPVYLLTDNSTQNLIVANYGDGSANPTSGLTVMPIRPDRSIAPYRQQIVYSSVPTVSHAHGLAKKTLDGVEYVFVTDLGTDTVYAYTFDNALPQPLRFFTSTSGASGQGPRHVVVSNDGKYLYVANEFDPAQPLTSSVSIYSFNPHTSPHLTLLTSVPAESIQPGDLTVNFPAELAILGSQLYVSNRGGNNIAEFNITDGGANLSFVDQFSVDDALWPREFAITPDGKYMVVAYQHSNNVVVFKIQENGALTQITTIQPINTPAAVAFVSKISTFGLSGNALAVANYLNALGPFFDGLAPIFSDLDFLPPSTLKKALNSIAPSRNAFATYTSQNTQFEFSILLGSRLSDQRALRSSHKSKQAYISQANGWTLDEKFFTADASERILLKEKQPEESYALWIGGFGEFPHTKAQHQNPSFHVDSGGTLAGFDYLGFANALIGGGIGYAHSAIHEAHHAGKATINTYVATLYGSAFLSHFYLEAALFGAYDQFKNKRTITFPGFDATAKSHYHGYQLTPHVGFGYDFNSHKATFEPFAAFDWAINFEKGYHEQGAAPLNMKIRHRTSSILRSEMGLNIYENLDFTWGVIVLREKISYVNKKLFRVGRISASIVGAPGSFTVEAFSPTQNLVSPAVELFIRSAKGWFGTLGYEGEFGSRYISNSILGKFGKYF